ncbi:unnamed protein product [Camellia sinensis]
MEEYTCKFANTLEARPDPGGECWQDIMKDQSMPKAIQGLMGHQGSLSLSALSKKKTDSHTSTETMEYSAKERRPFVKDFEPRPSITGYHDDDKLTEEKSFVKDIEPRPSITAYRDDDKLTKEKSFVKDFEPRPGITAYRGDDKLTEEKYFVKDFEPRPCITAYRDDNVGRGEAIYNQEGNYSVVSEHYHAFSVLDHGGCSKGMHMTELVFKCQVGSIYLVTSASIVCIMLSYQVYIVHGVLYVV